MTCRRFSLVALVLASTSLSLACSDLKETIAMTTNGRTGGGPSASRPPPPDVAPIAIGGIRYAQRAGDEAADGQVGGLLSAYTASGSLLWTIKVYDNRRRAGLEGDVQDVFFRSMSLDPDGRLRIVSETGLIYLVDVNTRIVTALPAAPRPDDGGLRPPPLVPPGTP